MAGDDDAILDDITAGDYSLESILAEYKGTAYINGDKKTPPEILNEQTERILREVVGSAKSGLLFSSNSGERARDAGDKTTAAGIMSRQVERSQVQNKPKPAEQSPVQSKPKPAEQAPVQSKPKPAEQAPVQSKPKPAEQSQVNSKAEPKAEPSENDRLLWNDADETPQHHDEVKDNAVLFFDNYRSQTMESQDSIIHNVEEAIKKEYGDAAGDFTGRSSGIRSRIRQSEEELNEEEEIPEEPDLRDAMKRFALTCNSVSMRCIPSAIISLIMAILTLTSEAGLLIPFGIRNNISAAVCALMISLLIVMMLCADIIVKGAQDLTRGVPNAETLILFSCAFSLISGAFSVLWGKPGLMPYCAVSAFSLTFAAIGEKYNLRAITETLKTATASSEPFGVQAEYNKEIDKSVLKKAYKRTDGFYNNLIHPDVSETAYRYAAPILLIAALVLSAFTALVRGHGEYFLHILSALLAAAAPFSAVLAFSLPFGIVAKSIRKSGAAIAGWGGADDICYTDGACVTDEDLFPPGTLSLSGMKLYDGISPEKAIRYTASLIIASGSGLANVFSEVLKSQGMNVIKVEDFTCYEGGIGALVRGERVMTGSSAFMDLLGVRVPDDVNMKNAVFTAINNKLTAMFAVDYSPANSVQSALISILKWRIKLFFAVRDFNVTPLMLSQKFRIPLEGIDYVQIKDSYSISDTNSGKEGRMAAVLTREGFGPFAEAVTGGKLLKTSAFVATVVSVVSAAFGVIIMFYLCWMGAFVSAKPGNLVLFMLLMLAADLIVCGYAKTRR